MLTNRVKLERKKRQLAHMTVAKNKILEFSRTLLNLSRIVTGRKKSQGLWEPQNIHHTLYVERNFNQNVTFFMTEKETKEMVHYHLFLFLEALFNRAQINGRSPLVLLKNKTGHYVILEKRAQICIETKKILYNAASILIFLNKIPYRFRF